MGAAVANVRTATVNDTKVVILIVVEEERQATDVLA